jgi:hypothetical protein
MIVEVRRFGERDGSLGHFELKENMQLDFSGVTDPAAREKLERLFRQEPALTAPRD